MSNIEQMIDEQSGAVAQRKMTTVQARQVASILSDRDGQVGELARELDNLVEEADKLNIQVDREFEDQRVAVSEKESPSNMRESLLIVRSEMANQQDKAGEIVGKALVVDNKEDAHEMETIRRIAEKLQEQTVEILTKMANYDRALVREQREMDGPKRQVNMGPGFYPHTNSIHEDPVWPNVGVVPEDENGVPILAHIDRDEPVKLRTELVEIDPELKKKHDIPHPSDSISR